MKDDELLDRIAAFSSEPVYPYGWGFVYLGVIARHVQALEQAAKGDGLWGDREEIRHQRERAERAERERDEALGQVDGWRFIATTQTGQERDAARASEARLLAYIKRRGHSPGCRCASGSEQECTCGLRVLLDGSAEA